MHSVVIRPPIRSSHRGINGREGNFVSTSPENGHHPSPNPRYFSTQ